MSLPDSGQGAQRGRRGSEVWVARHFSSSSRRWRSADSILDLAEDSFEEQRINAPLGKMNL